jgi:predicted RND superfamily exporter protein
MIMAPRGVRGSLSMEAWLARSLVQHRYLYLLLSLALAMVATAGARLLWFESDYRIFFDDDNPQLVAYDAIESDYTRGDNVVFVLQPRSGAVFTQEVLSAVRDLTERGWRIPRAIRVDSVSNFQHSEAVDDDLIVDNLVPEGVLDQEMLTRIRRIALDEPALTPGLLAPDASITLVNVRLELPTDSREQGVATQEIMAHVHELVAAFAAEYPDIDVHLIGQVLVNYSFNHSAEQDAMTLVPAMFMVVVLLLGLFLRSLAGVAAAVAVIIMSIGVTLGMTGWLGFQMNQVNVSAPVIILTLAVSDCVHILLAYFSALGRRGGARLASMEEALRVNIKPIVLTSITTAIGFFSLNFSDSPPFRELGNSVGIGVIGAMLWSLMALPAIVLMFPPPRRVNGSAARRDQRFERLAERVLRHHRLIFFLTLGAALLVVSQAARNELNDDTIKYFHERTAVRQAFDLVQEQVMGVDTIIYSLPADGENGIYDPDYLHAVERFAEYLRAQPAASHVMTFNDVVKRLNRNMNNGDPAFYVIPEQRDLIAQYVLFYELSLPLGLDLNDLVTFDKSATRLQVNLRNVKAQDLIDFERAVQVWMADNTPEIQVDGTSVSLMFAHIGQNNIRSMMRGSAVALVLIALTLIIALRSVRFGLLSLLPNAFPAAISFGVWGMFVGEVNLAVAAVFSITLGIVVDNTVHFFSKYLYARQVQGADTAQAIRYAYGMVGAALSVTAVALGVGFAVLAFSDFGVNSSMGIMTAMTIIIALVFDLLFLPGLLMRFDRAATAVRDPAP